MFLLINKPAGITSHDVVNRLRQITGIKKIGHAGTLDPFATGLLIMAIERESTKEIDQFVKQDKEYIATLKLGAVSDTFDKTGKISDTGYQILDIKDAPTISNIPARNATHSVAGGQYPISGHPKLKGIQEILKVFIGKQLQIPPMFSAKKINGQKLYNLARQGKEVERQPVEIEIKKIEILNYNFPYLEILIECTSGTYIRSLGNDIGQKLGTGAYLEELQRTKIGKYKIEDAIDLDKLNPENWKEHIF